VGSSSCFRYHLGAVAAVIFWGLSFIAAKYAMRELPPFVLATVRFLIASAIFMVIIAVRGWHILPEPQERIPVLFLGFLGVTFLFALQYSGIYLTSSAQASALVGAAPIFIALLSVWLLGEQIPIRTLAGIIVAFAGMTVVISHGSLAGFRSGTNLIGSSMILLNSLSWALFSVLGKKYSFRYHPMQLTGYVSIAGTILLLPLGVVQAIFLPVPFHLSLGTWGAVLFLSVFCSVLGYWLWYEALAHVKASTIGVYLYGEQAVTFAFAPLLIGEKLGYALLFGTALIILGIVIVARRDI